MAAELTMKRDKHQQIVKLFESQNSCFFYDDIIKDKLYVYGT